MRKIFLIAAIFLSLNSNAQFIQQDGSLGNVCYVNILLTDSSSYIYNLPMKMTVYNTDQGDSTNGADIIFSIYTAGASPSLVNGNRFPLKGINYYSWDKNNSKEIYQFTQYALATKKTYITFQP